MLITAKVQRKGRAQNTADRHGAHHWQQKPWWIMQGLPRSGLGGLSAIKGWGWLPIEAKLPCRTTLQPDFRWVYKAPGSSDPRGVRGGPSAYPIASMHVPSLQDARPMEWKFYGVKYRRGCTDHYYYYYYYYSTPWKLYPLLLSRLYCSLNCADPSTQQYLMPLHDHPCSPTMHSTCYACENNITVSVSCATVALTL